MRSVYKFLLGVFAAWAMAMPAHAFMPESGWWWNPSQSGRGFNLEIQNKRLFISIYSYTASGEPFAYGAGGEMSSDRTFTGTLTLTKGGPCLGCAYTQPTTQAAGTVTVAFDSPTTGTVTLPGSAPIPIQRFVFGLDAGNINLLMGEWTVVRGGGSFPVYFGERISFWTNQTSNGKLYAVGSRSRSPGDIAVASQDSSGQYILLDSSTSYYQFYALTPSGLNALEGRSWTYLKTSEPSGAGLPVLAMRSRSAAAVATGSGPGFASALENPMSVSTPPNDGERARQAAMQATEERRQQAASGATEGRLPPELRAVLASLQAQLQ
ncbi:MAG: hypothetical protein KDA37_00060 [Planctomycetales bacterium]|nr:hypothetical protein [Planctomycetales bacterium]